MCDRYAALWQTEHSGVFILCVEASLLVAEVIGLKQSLVFIDLIEKWGNEVLLCDIAVRDVFFPTFKDWRQRANNEEN